MPRTIPRPDCVTPEQAERIKRGYGVLHDSNRNCLLLLEMMRIFPENREIADRVIGVASGTNSTLRILRCVICAAKDEQPANIEVIFSTHKEHDPNSSGPSDMESNFLDIPNPDPSIDSQLFQIMDLAVTIAECSFKGPWR